MRALRSLSLCLVAGTLALVLASPNANASPVIAFTGGDDDNVTGNSSLGYEFLTGQAITVTALDVLDASALGFSSYDNPGQVRLYDAGGDLLASATLATSDPTEVAGAFTFYTASITPVELAADTDYFIVEDTAANDDLLINSASGFSGQYGVSFVTGVGQSGFGNDPTSNVGISGLAEDGYITGNFDASPTAAPEPSSFLLLGTGLLGVVGVMRKRFV
jgi:hypothetical protein